jgi:hypothetical protein
MRQSSRAGGKDQKFAYESHNMPRIMCRGGGFGRPEGTCHPGESKMETIQMLALLFNTAILIQFVRKGER